MDLAKYERGQAIDAVDAPVAVTGSVDERSSRVLAEVQAGMIVAHRFPRDENQAFARVMRSCSRRGLAEAALYEYPRGGTRVTGPSIRLAEVLAQSWGNLDFGIVELDQRAGESTVMAYAWDLETNVRQTKIFVVRHVRDTKAGRVDLEDARDVYEMTANMGARRLRACILGVIPGDFVDAAVKKCGETLAAQGDGVPLADRVRLMVSAFAEVGVTQGMIAARLGHSMDAISEHELAGLRRIYLSIRDQMASPASFFAGPAGGGVPEPHDPETGEVSESSTASNGNGIAKRRPGRPRGSKNRPPEDQAAARRAEMDEAARRAAEGHAAASAPAQNAPKPAAAAPVDPAPPVAPAAVQRPPVAAPPAPARRDEPPPPKDDDQVDWTRDDDEVS